MISSVEKINGSYKITFNINRKFLKYFASKGSVSIDGVSLTVNDVDKDFFTVNIIPYTWIHTSFRNYIIGTLVNVEIDTGRTHQIRIHASKLNHHIIFDKKYGDKDFDKSLNIGNHQIALHAKEIIFPDLNNKMIRVKSKLPVEFNNLISSLE